MNIHPTAIIDPKATLALDVTVGPYAVIGKEVTIGMGTVIGPHAIIEGPTVIGPNCRIFNSASVGTAPQDLKYAEEPTRLVIGSDNTIREFVTLHRGTANGRSVTTIGSNNLFMAYSHVAHDCIVGSYNVLGNCAALAGHCECGSHVIIGGLAGIHQFSRLGDHAFIGGCAAVAQDVPPFLIASGNRAVANAINRIGLKRRGFSSEVIMAIHKAFKIIYLRKLALKDALQKIDSEFGQFDEIQYFLRFIRETKRGIIKHGRD